MEPITGGVISVITLSAIACVNECRPSAALMQMNQDKLNLAQDNMISMIRGFPYYFYISRQLCNTQFTLFKRSSMKHTLHERKETMASSLLVLHTNIITE